MVAHGALKEQIDRQAQRLLVPGHSCQLCMTLATVPRLCICFPSWAVPRQMAHDIRLPHVLRR